MSALGTLALLRPAWLLAVVPLLALIWVWRRRPANVGDWATVVDPVLMEGLRALGQVDVRGVRRAGLPALVATGVILLALTGPAVQRRDAAAFRNLDGVVFVLDSSLSMTESSAWPMVQTMGRFGIAAVGSRPAGLVVFAGDAYVASDLTGDTDQVGLTLSLIDGATVPDKGSRPALGLALAADMLTSAEVLAGDVVLLTDSAGVDADSFAMAARIAAQGARLSVIGTDPASPSLQSLAEIGKGQVFGLRDADAIAAFLGQSGRDRLEKQDYPLLFWSDLGRWLLLVALVPVLALFRKRGAGA